MSHVDEGTLHAYLDGELPSAERASVEQHLAGCTACHARLTEERALLERANAVLGSARPRALAQPPLEQLRRPAPSRRGRWHVRTPFAWAASVALAIAVGYYIHSPSGTTDQLDSSRSGNVNATQQYSAVPPTPPAAPAGRVAAPAPHRSERRDPARREPASDAARAEDRVGDSTVAGVVALQPPAALRNAAPSRVDTAARPQSVASSAAAASLRAQREPPLIETAPTPSRQRLVPRDLGATIWPVISRGAAASLLGEKPVGLPGVATRAIRRSPAGDGTVVVEQVLDSGTVIQVFQRPASVTAPMDSAGGASYYDRNDRLLARFVGRLRVEIAGPLSPDSLNRLLEQVEPLP